MAMAYGRQVKRRGRGGVTLYLYLYVLFFWTTSGTYGTVKDMKNFCMVWSSLLDSSLWIGGTKDARIVWITLLALKDKNGQVHITDMGLAHRAIVGLDECLEALQFLSSPDPMSANKDHEGRRIIPIDGGWEIVSHDKYRFSTEAARAYWRESKRLQRGRKTGHTSAGPSAQEIVETSNE